MMLWNPIEWGREMKGRRNTAEEKIRIQRKAERGKSILDVAREHNFSEQTFHRWKRAPSEAG
jgi:transposase-like protein